jgi:hypothetical protein
VPRLLVFALAIVSAPPADAAPPKALKAVSTTRAAVALSWTAGIRTSISGSTSHRRFK